MNLFKRLCVLCLGLLVAGCASVSMTGDQRNSIQGAAASVLPNEARVEILTERSSSGEPVLVISARLLDGLTPSETSPAVQGDYRSINGLTKAVRYRAARVLRAVAVNGEYPDVDLVAVEARHGVRQKVVGRTYGGEDISKVLYAVSVPKQDLQSNDLAQMSDEQIMAMWTVEKNILPRLTVERPGGYKDKDEDKKK